MQPEQHALTSRNLRTNLAHSPECKWDFLLVAARYAAREDVHVIAVLERVQGRLQHVDMRLRRLIRTID